MADGLPPPPQRTTWTKRGPRYFPGWVMALIVVALLGYGLLIWFVFVGSGPLVAFLGMLAVWALQSAALTVAWWNVKRKPVARAINTGLEFYEADQADFDAFARGDSP